MGREKIRYQYTLDNGVIHFRGELDKVTVAIDLARGIGVEGDTFLFHCPLLPLHVLYLQNKSNFNSIHITNLIGITK